MKIIGCGNETAKKSLTEVFKVVCVSCDMWNCAGNVAWQLMKNLKFNNSHTTNHMQHKICSLTKGDARNRGKCAHHIKFSILFPNDFHSELKEGKKFGRDDIKKGEIISI